jgi:hypothetical protein
MSTFERRGGRLVNIDVEKAKPAKKKLSEEAHYPIYAMELNFETKYIAALFVQAIAVAKRFPKNCCRPWKHLHDELELIWAKMDRHLHKREVRGLSTHHDSKLFDYVSNLTSYALGANNILPRRIKELFRNDN